MRKRKMGRRPRLPWRAATVILLVMYNLGMSYREMEGYLRFRPGLLRRLELKRAPGKSNLNRAYHQLDYVWFRRLNERIVARVMREGGSHQIMKKSIYTILNSMSGYLNEKGMRYY